MRRIIERVVTVVTTTTWKISWEADPHPSNLAADPVSDGTLHLEILPESTPPGPTVFEPKEVDLPEEKENAPDQP
jgi:hypothetical protein